jgi:hypothetical protein
MSHPTLDHSKLFDLSHRISRAGEVSPPAREMRVTNCRGIASNTIRTVAPTDPKLDFCHQTACSPPRLGKNFKSFILLAIDGFFVLALALPCNTESINLNRCFI